jgi:hypothetical protein
MMKKYLKPLSVKSASATLMLLTALCAAACTDKPTPPIKTSTPPEVSLGGGLNLPWGTNGVEPKEPVIEPSKDAAPKSANAKSANAKSDMSKAQESRSMPMPGQANDHSVLEPPSAQKPPATKP